MPDPAPKMSFEDEFVAAMARPGPVAEKVRAVYGIDRSTRSNIARSNSDTSGRDERSSNTPRSLAESRLPSWWQAVITPPIMSMIVPRASVTSLLKASSVKSLIAALPLLFRRLKPNHRSDDSATTKAGGEDA